jgi:hypothetical protein
MSMKNSNDHIGNRSCDLPVCSAVPQPLHYRVPHIIIIIIIIIIPYHSPFLPGTSLEPSVPPTTNTPLPHCSIARAEPDDTCAETRFRLSEKRTSPFQSAGVSAQSASRRLCVNIVSWGRLLSVANTLICFNPCKESENFDFKTYVFVVGSNVGQILTCISLSIAGLPPPFACFP